MGQYRLLHYYFFDEKYALGRNFKGDASDAFLFEKGNFVLEISNTSKQI